ncbi:MAG: prephenate dehydratase [Myxococcota bacterium]|nr:prephenate dehydratase [Myxococcota bacterium]
MNEPRSKSKTPPTPDAEAGLEALRCEIDAVDRRILDELNRRARLVQEVGELKQRAATSVYRAARERDLVAALAAENPGPFPNGAIAPVFREIISGTRSLETRLRIAYLGPPGTFSHLAGHETFGTQADFVPVGTIPEVLSAVERGEADHGIVPVENTTEGVVTQALDALLDCELELCGEALLRISLHLFSADGDLSRVQRVASHPQPLAQSRNWLDRNLPGVERVEVSSTAAAASMAQEQPGVAAVGGSLVGELAGLTLLARSIEDRRDNTTRFVVVGGEAPAASGNDLTVVAFTVRKGQSGALYGLLEPFAKHGVNLTSIQARPLKGRPWEYVFFLEIEGHRSEAAVQAAYDEASGRANSNRILGSFPRAAGASSREGGAPL